jgi:hypothetical protein
MLIHRTPPEYRIYKGHNYTFDYAFAHGHQLPKNTQMLVYHTRTFGYTWCNGEYRENLGLQVIYFRDRYSDNQVFLLSSQVRKVGLREQRLIDSKFDINKLMAKITREVK